VERFNLKELNEEDGKGHTILRFQIGFWLWKFWKVRWILIELLKRLEKI
jgi:hypothetical protein